MGAETANGSRAAPYATDGRTGALSLPWARFVGQSPYKNYLNSGGGPTYGNICLMLNLITKVVKTESRTATATIQPRGGDLHLAL